MAVPDERPFSVTKVMAGAGGGLLIAAFLLPLIDVQAPGAAGSDLFGVQRMRAAIDRSAELTVVKPLIEPAILQLENFARAPSLRNLSSVAAATKEVLDTAAGAGVPNAEEIRGASTVLGLVRLCLWLVPLVGVVQVAVPLATRLRGYAGFFGLLARFAFGLLFVLLALLPVLGAPGASKAYIGPAVWAALSGGLLMIAAGVAGVTRSNWWLVYIAQAGVVAAWVMILSALAGLVDQA